MPYKNKEDQQAWRDAHRESRKIYDKAYREANKEKKLAQDKAYREANKEEIKAYKKALYIVDKEAIKAKTKAYRKENKELVQALGAKYRLLKANAKAAMSDAEKENYANLVVIRDNATALFGYAWHIDHTIPLSKGGTNAIDNLEVVPASWNLIKSNSNSDSFWG